MEIMGLNGKRIRIGKTSITCVGDNGKTCGLVRGIFNIDSCTGSRQFDLFQVVNKAGLWGSKQDFSKNVFSDGKTVFYIHNSRLDETYKKYFEGKEGFENEEKHHLERQEARQKAINAGFVVVDCNVMQ